MMEQTKLNDEKWEQKDLRSARQSSIRSSSEIIAAMISVGAYKPENPEEAIRMTIKYAQEFVDFIYKDMKKSQPPAGTKKYVRVKLTSGKEKTIDHKEELSQLGFHWEKELKAWTAKFDIDYWNKIKGKVVGKFNVKVE